VRLTSDFWVSAYLRRVHTAGMFAAVVHRGAAEAGAIYVKVNLLDGRALVLGPAPQSFFEEGGRSSGRLWLPYRGGEPLSEPDADRYLASERRFDPDLWVGEIESREGQALRLPDEIAPASSA